MRRTVRLVVVLALVAAACGGAATSTSSTADTGSSTAPSTVDVPVGDGPAAPDFTLELADGGEFVLSAEQKPVYMVFWAEW